MTASDAQRVEQIYSLLHLDEADRESPEVGQVVAREQPKPHESMAGIEDAIGLAVGLPHALATTTR